MESRIAENGDGGVPSSNCGTISVVRGVEYKRLGKKEAIMGVAGSPKLGESSTSTAERETATIMAKKISEMAADGSILIDPTRPDTLLRAEVEALRAICEEPLRTFRRSTSLDGPGWKSFGSSSKHMYQLLAVGNVVWRCVSSGVAGEKVEYEKIEGTLLDKAGYLWQRERGRWDRLPAPDEEAKGRVEIEETLRDISGVDAIMEDA